MKKLLAFVLVAAMLLTMGITVAYAYNSSASFNMGVQCVTDTDLTKSGAWITKATTYKGVYVRHTVIGGSNSYTNYFQAYRDKDGVEWGSGYKFCTPGLEVPIQSNTLTVNTDVTVYARGNTNHYIYDGVTNVTLKGTIKG